MNTLSPNQLANGVFSTTSQLPNLKLYLESLKTLENRSIKIINGDACTTKEKLFDEFSKVLQFPTYFGKNWDAFDECITDLSWLPTKTIILVITNSNSLLSSEDSKQLKTFLSIILSTIQFWKEKATISIIFQSENEINPEIKSALNLKELPLS